MDLELIGEEIYDEFDTQGAHGDPYEVPPIHTQEHDGDHLKATNTPQTSQLSSVNHRPSNPFSGHLTAQMPTLLKGLVRTRSAPPVPRGEGENTTIGSEKVTRFADDYKQEIAPQVAAPGIQMPKPMRSSGRNPPSVILEQQSSISSTNSGVAATLVPAPIDAPTFGRAPVQTLGVNISPPAGTALVTSGVTTPYPTHGVAAPALHYGDPLGANTASPSPIPALEAILLDRKRRLAASTGGTAGGLRTSSSSTSTVASMGVSQSKEAMVSVLPGSSKNVHGVSAKGTRFKSSPLGGADRAGVIVAEQIKAASEVDHWKEVGGEHDGGEGKKF